MKKSIFILLLSISLFAFTTTGCALLSAAGLTNRGLPTPQVPEKLTSTTANSSVNLDHSDWTALLKKHVDKEGNVDYKGFKKDRAALTSYLNYLSQNKPDKDWSVQELLAYYINVYNAFTVELIVENYPVNSIKDINGPWTRAIVPIGNINMSLGGVENGLLKKMNDPRFHFAINCASVSCPKLLDEAYTAASINEQLDRAAREFINSLENKISENKAELSRIFDWYEKDFKVNNIESVIEYVNQYSNTKINPGATITYLEYDWGLNEKK
ncbi:MAG: DUF547 domain-containing protein [Flavobacteriaceae bacterium]|nr:DUF547 domain-containing protein [Flavobacteriaceae bacterium]